MNKFVIIMKLKFGNMSIYWGLTSSRSCQVCSTQWRGQERLHEYHRDDVCIYWINNRCNSICTNHLRHLDSYKNIFPVPVHLRFKLLHIFLTPYNNIHYIRIYFPGPEGILIWRIYCTWINPRYSKDQVYYSISFFEGSNVG